MAALSNITYLEDEVSPAFSTADSRQSLTHAVHENDKGGLDVYSRM
jgi:uncharacterized protein YchJ